MGPPRLHTHGTGTSLQSSGALLHTWPGKLSRNDSPLALYCLIRVEGFINPKQIRVWRELILLQPLFTDREPRLVCV